MHKHDLIYTTSSRF